MNNTDLIKIAELMTKSSAPKIPPAIAKKLHAMLGSMESAVKHHSTGNLKASGGSLTEALGHMSDFAKKGIDPKRFTGYKEFESFKSRDKQIKQYMKKNPKFEKFVESHVLGSFSRKAPKPSAPKPSAPKPSAPKPSAPKPSAPKPSAPKPSAPRPSSSSRPSGTRTSIDTSMTPGEIAGVAGLGATVAGGGYLAAKHFSKKKEASLIEIVGLVKSAESSAERRHKYLSKMHKLQAEKHKARNEYLAGQSQAEAATHSAIGGGLYGAAIGHLTSPEGKGLKRSLKGLAIGIPVGAGLGLVGRHIARKMEEK